MNLAKCNNSWGHFPNRVGIYRSPWDLELLVSFRRGENRSIRRKTSPNKDEDEQQTQSTYDIESPGNDPGPR